MGVSGESSPSPAPSRSASICQQGLSITADIDLDNRAGREPIITGSFIQLMSIQLPLNLCWAAKLTRREGAGMQKGIPGINNSPA